MDELFGKHNFIAHRRESDGKEQSLSEHLKNVSNLTGKLAAKAGLEKEGQLIGLLHDLGKASNEFDKYIRSAVGLIEPDEDDYVDTVEKKGKVDHSTAGAQIICGKGYNTASQMITLQILSVCIASHHSGLIDCLDANGNDKLTKRMNKLSERTHVDEIKSKMSKDFIEEVDNRLSEKMYENVQSCLSGLVDRTNDSNETIFFKWHLIVRYLFSCLIEADRLDTANFEVPKLIKIRNNWEYKSWDILINRLEIKIANFENKSNKSKVDKIRIDISFKCLEFSKKDKGIYKLTVPTGGGKTLSSLRFALNHAEAHKMDRIIYVLPYTSIIDQNAQTIREILEDKDEKGRYSDRIVLEHHSNLTPNEESKRQKILSENWDAPIVLTTVVQLLESLFDGNASNARRMHCLANSVIIMDEIQTIPIKCVHMFNVAMNFLTKNCGSTVLLCTATQPLLDKIKPKERAIMLEEGHQIIMNIEELFQDLKRVEVFDKRKPGGWSVEETKNLVYAELAATGSVLAIVNTKKSAIELYQACNGSLGDKLVEIYHLSTNMCPAHRMEIIDSVQNCLPNKKPVICISTQLIEAGIDIDFGSVIRHLAGLDSIAQAAGRCNRNGLRPKQGRVWIINPNKENTGSLRDIKIGIEKAERVLDEYKKDAKQFDKNILGPKAMERYFEYYFYQRQQEMNYIVGKNSKLGRDGNLFDLLATNSISVEEYKRINNEAPKISIRQAFMTAGKTFQVIDAPTKGIIVPFGEGKKIIEQLCNDITIEDQYRILRKAQRFSVNVFPQVFTKLEGAIYQTKAESGIYYLDEKYYSAKFGLSDEIVNNMSFLNY